MALITAGVIASVWLVNARQLGGLHIWFHDKHSVAFSLTVSVAAMSISGSIMLIDMGSVVILDSLVVHVRLLDA